MIYNYFSTVYRKDIYVRNSRGFPLFFKIYLYLNFPLPIYGNMQTNFTYFLERSGEKITINIYRKRQPQYPETSWPQLLSKVCLRGTEGRIKLNISENIESYILIIVEYIQFNVTTSALGTANIKLDIENSIKTRAIFSVAAEAELIIAVHITLCKLPQNYFICSYN